MSLYGIIVRAAPALGFAHWRNVDFIGLSWLSQAVPLSR